MKRNIAICLSLLFVLGLFAPLGHLLFDEHHFEVHACEVGLNEYCGGAANPCSQQEHEHSKSTSTEHDCLVCQSIQFVPTVQKSQSSFVHSFSVVEQLSKRTEIVFSIQKVSQLGSRAPPVNS